MTKSRPWASLSPEIRHKILKEVAQQKRAGRASLASVKKEWQLVIAKEDFRFPLLVVNLPTTLKKVSVIEDFSGSLTAVLVEDRNQNPISMRTQEAARVVDPGIGADFASKSRDLEQFSVSYMGAGMTAPRTPRLRSLAIWDGWHGNACAFIYHTDRNYAYVTWRGTLEMDLSPQAVEV
ncbi:hypothetical protein N657DRAFT_687040 [Parathielavia appendiculata]|uniref:DUF6546 domain-containing protein n=1 Tax=Parathielavia appendiculata TaxID=2587402 RepID=A0AAN6UB48_9PEZI|nr:hypothetical protein N657DRAFT_687040 [Parathielavia appendiculata]